VVWYSFQALTTGSYIGPADALSSWANLRYGVTILPAFAYLAAVGLPKRAGALAGLAVVAAGGALMLANSQVAGYEDSLHDVPAERATIRPGADWLHEHAGGAKVLVPVQDPRVDRFELRAQLDLARFVDSTDPRQYNELRKHPDRIEGQGVRWIVWVGGRGPTLVDRVVRVSGAHQCWARPSTGPGVPPVRIYSIEPGCET
jgi:hypothetical protein